MRRRDFLGALGMGLGAAFGPGVESPLSRRAYRRPAGVSDRHFIERWSWAMGQPVHLQLFAASSDQGYAAAAAALAELRRVEQKLSLFDDSSDLAELNRKAGRSRVRVSGDLATVLAAGLRFERLTDGAFNPAIEPLMRAWGFRTRRTSEPTSSELAQARSAVLAARIIVEHGQAFLPNADTRLDLGGIGVGYGLDQAAARLREAGIRRAFLDVSGDCIALGAPPDQEGWLVEIAGARSADRSLGSIHLCDAALATSSNTKTMVRFGRAVRGHVLNPVSGWPADALVQASVVARSGIEADALSTAMLVSGNPAAGVLRYYKT